MKIEVLLYLSIALAILTIAGNVLVLTLVRYKLGCLRDRMIPAAPVTLEVTEHPETTLKLFKAYLKHFGKHYEGEEFTKRFGIFENSLKDVHVMNQISGAKFGLTKFSDKTIDELVPPPSRMDTERAYHCEPKMETCEGGPHVNNLDYHYNTSIPDRFDWRDKGYVGPVLDQKNCNGCWAFGIVGAIESRAAIQNKIFGPRRSVQELIDCADSKGCEAGNVYKALYGLCNKKWGVVTEKEYPLKDVTQTCKYRHHAAPPVGLHVKQFWKLCHMTRAEDIPRLVHFHGPLMVLVNAFPWLGYIDGVIQRGCHRKPGITFDHVVQIVGYDRTAEVPHYIVRNSWGEDFGMGGYVKLAMDEDVCGVKDEGYVVHVYPKPY